jgi:P4 family phage/plasmid primase-like protien
MNNEQTFESASNNTDNLTNGMNISEFDAPTLPGIDSRDGKNNTRPLSELGNACRLLDTHSGDIYYIYEARAWLYWEGGAWCYDIDGAKIRSLAAKLPDQIYTEGNSHLVDAELFAKWSRMSQKESTIKKSVSLLSDIEQVRLQLCRIDIDLFLVGIDNAKQVINLKTGQAKPAARSDYITKSLNIKQLGDSSKAVRWLEFLDQVFGDDIELIDWIKRWCGYLLTGSTEEHFFIFCYGLGANGKSVLAEAMRYILGDYARAIASETLTKSKRSAGGATPDIADLIGARLAMCSETESGAALAESLIKSLVSGDSMTARKLYSAPMQFTPHFKLMMLGNHKPIIKSNDYGMWRRIRLIPFLRTFKPEERDPALLNKLKSEAPHILAWMVEGCLDWQKRGLKDVPVSIQQATGEYQEDQDLIGRWLSECCKQSPSSKTLSNMLYNNYKKWCIINGLQAVSKVALGRSLGERGFNRQKSGNSVWQGIELKPPNVDDEA